MGIPGGGPGRFVSNVLARVLILINLRGVKLRVGLGRGVRYYKELRIKVRVKAKVGDTVRVRVKDKVRVRLRVKVRVRVRVRVRIRVRVS